MSSNTTKTTHKSGLRLVSHFMPDAPGVSLSIFVHTGSRFESEQNNGMAHFFEHMVFKGTTTRPSPYQISFDLESIGAEVNAATDREYTTYYIKVLKQNLHKGAEILFDAFLHSTLKEEEIDKERNVVKEEIKMYEDDPDSFADNKLMDNLYPHDPYGRRTLGTNNTLDWLNSERMNAFYKQNYFFENTIIVATGNIQHTELEKLIEDQFDFTSYEHGSNVDPGYIDGHFTEENCYYTKDIQQAQLRMSTYSVPFNHPDKYKVSVALDVLGAGMGSKLFIEIRENRGLAYSIYSYDYHWSKSGFVVIGAGLMPEKIESVQKICLEEISKIGDGNITAEELTRAKELSKASILMNMDTTDNWAWYLGKQEAIYGNIKSIEDVVSSIDKVTKEDVEQTMQQLSSQSWHSTIVKGNV